MKGVIPKYRFITIALYGLILNTIWEFVQAGPLYDMWEEVSLAILGDVLLVLGVAGASVIICGSSNVFPLSLKGCISLITIGFIAGLLLEWIAKALDWWTYNELMPVISVMGETVGLAPLLQVTLLPFLSVLLTDKAGGVPQALVNKIS